MHALRNLRLLWWAGAPLFSACDFPDRLADTSDDLLNPSASLIDQPGRHVVKGRFRQLSWAGTLSVGARMLALDVADTRPHLTIFTYPVDESCDAGPATGYHASFRQEGPGFVTILFDPDGDGRGQVRFSDLDCNEVLPALEEVELTPRVMNALKGNFVLDGDSTLHLLDTQPPEHAIFAENVTDYGVESVAGITWTIESGQVVIRSSDAPEPIRAGDGVTRFVPTGGVSRAFGAYETDQGIFLLDWAGDSVLLSEGGCSLEEPEAKGTAIQYFDPCEERRLVIEQWGEPRIRFLGPSFVIGPPVRFDGKSFHHLVHRDPDATTGDLVQTSYFLSRDDPLVEAIADPGAELSEVVDREGRPVVLMSDVHFEEWRLYGDWDGTTGDLLDLEVTHDFESDTLESEISILAERVLPVFSWPLALAHSDGNSGSLLFFDSTENKEPVEIASGVIPQEIAALSSTTDFALVADADGKMGNVYRFRTDSTMGSERIPTERPAIASSLQHLPNPLALAYFTLTTPGKSDDKQLRVWLFDSELDLKLHDNVSEYTVHHDAPFPGISYVVPDGPDAGIWFAKAR